MKLRPVRICDVSRTLRISSASLIEFLQSKGYSVIGDYFSPITSRMVELIQNGFHEGPPFQELTPYLTQAETWERENSEVVNQLHAPPPPRQKPEVIRREYRPRKPRVPRFSFAPTPALVFTGRIALTPLDLELIHRSLELSEAGKTVVRDYLRRRTILKAISKMEEQ